MQLTQDKVGDTGKRVQEFLDSQADALGTAVPAPLRAKLDAAMAQFNTAKQEQQALFAVVPAEIAKQNAIRKELNVDLLGPVARIVRRAFKTSPDYQAVVVPSTLTRKGEFVSKVIAAADAAAKHEKDLLDHGMPVDFVAQLRAAVGQLEVSVDARGKQVGLLKQATQGMKDSTKAIRDALHIMDGQITRQLKKNQPLLANWVATKRIQATVVTPLPGGDLSAKTTTPSTTAVAATTASAKPAA